MKEYNVIGDVLSGIGLVYGAVNVKEVLGIVLLVLNIFTILLRAGFKLWGWYKKSKEDGVITKEEIDEAIQIISATKDDIEKGGKDNE